MARSPGFLLAGILVGLAFSSIAAGDVNYIAVINNTTIITIYSMHMQHDPSLRKVYITVKWVVAVAHGVFPKLPGADVVVAHSVL